MAQDTLRVHFLYGSKPAKGFKKEQEKLFGGINGGHVSLECGDGIYGFGPEGRFHLVARKGEKRRHSYFRYDSREAFAADSIDKQYMTIFIPVEPTTIARIDSIHQCYHNDSPYDYAFLGMRCTASVYDILAQAGLEKERKQKGIWWKYFYPRRLRNHMVKEAVENGWPIYIHDGTEQRKWERELRRTRKLLEEAEMVSP